MPRLRVTIRVIDDVDDVEKGSAIADVALAVDEFFEDESVQSVTVTVDEQVNGTNWIRVTKKSREK